jgi:hypothetical protein
VFCSSGFAAAEALVHRCTLADGARIEPRQPVVATVRTDENRGREGRGPVRAFWEPLVAVLRPASTNEL